MRDGRVVADPERDLAKLAVVERHHATGPGRRRARARLRPARRRVRLDRRARRAQPRRRRASTTRACAPASSGSPSSAAGSRSPTAARSAASSRCRSPGCCPRRRPRTSSQRLDALVALLREQGVARRRAVHDAQLPRALRHPGRSSSPTAGWSTWSPRASSRSRCDRGDPPRAVGAGRAVQLLDALNAPEMMAHLGGPEPADKLDERQARYLEPRLADVHHPRGRRARGQRSASGTASGAARTSTRCGWLVAAARIRGAAIATRATELVLDRVRADGAPPRGPRLPGASRTRRRTRSAAARVHPARARRTSSTRPAPGCTATTGGSSWTRPSGEGVLMLPLMFRRHPDRRRCSRSWTPTSRTPSRRPGTRGSPRSWRSRRCSRRSRRSSCCRSPASRSRTARSATSPRSARRRSAPCSARCCCTCSRGVGGRPLVHAAASAAAHHRARPRPRRRLVRPPRGADRAASGGSSRASAASSRCPPGWPEMPVGRFLAATTAGALRLERALLGAGALLGAQYDRIEGIRRPGRDGRAASRSCSRCVAGVVWLRRGG